MSLARNIATVGSAAMLSRLLGFLRDVGIAAVLGAGPLSDAFFAALQAPNLFRRLLAEGALNSAFVPMWLRLRREGGIDAARGFGGAVLGVVLLALAAIVVLGVAFAPVVIHALAPGFSPGGGRFTNAVEFLRLCLPYVVIAGGVAVAAAILNAEGRVAAAAFGLVVFNGVMLVAVAIALLAPSQKDAGLILALGVVFAGLGQFAIVGRAAARLPDSPFAIRLSVGQLTRRFFVRMVPGVLAGGAPQVKFMIAVMVVSSSPAAVSWLYYANRLYELPLGIASVAISAVLMPGIAASLQTGDRTTIAAAQSRSLDLALGLACPAAIGFALLSEEIAGTLFERGAFDADDTAAVAAALAAICAGLPGHVLEKVMGAISFSHEDTRTPMLAALAGLLVALLGAVALFPLYGHVGVAAAIAVSGWVGALVLGLIVSRRGWLALDGAAIGRLAAIAGASIIMGVIVLSAKGGTAAALAALAPGAARALSLAALIALGGAVYFASLQILGVARLRDITAALRQRL